MNPFSNVLSSLGRALEERAMERNTFINRFEWENQHTSKFWYISLLLRWEATFPGGNAQNSCVSLDDRTNCLPRQATGKHHECFTVHLIATVDSEFRLLVCGIMDPAAHLPQRRLSAFQSAKILGCRTSQNGNTRPPTSTYL